MSELTATEQTAPTVPDIEAEIRERTESIVADKRRQAKNYRDVADKCEAEIPGVEAKVREFYGVKAALEAAGFEPKASHWCLTMSVKDVERKDLVPLAQVLGYLKEQCREAIEKYNDKGTQVKPTHARVTFESSKYPFVEVTMAVKLDKTVKCHIRTEKVRKLVCDV